MEEKKFFFLLFTSKNRMAALSATQTARARMYSRASYVLDGTRVNNANTVEVELNTLSSCPHE